MCDTCEDREPDDRPLTVAEWRRLPAWLKRHMRQEAERSMKRLELMAKLLKGGKLVQTGESVDWSARFDRRTSKFNA